MAGMLPGVEVARRRRFHQSGLDSPCSSGYGFGTTRRSSFCLYPSNHESHIGSIAPAAVHRSPVFEEFCDYKLGDAAREAKKRLDGRLRYQWKSSEHKRGLSNLQVPRQIEPEEMQVPRQAEQREIQSEMCKLKRSGSKRFNWPKLGWKSSEQDECTVCLEQFKTGENLIHLPCAHRFHSKCLLPWLDNNSHCPCCRLELCN